VARTTAELDPRNENSSADATAPQPEPKRLPAARIAFVRFALAEIEQLPEDGPPTR
jgi:hypothetical protein